MEHKETIYERMSKEKLAVAAAFIDVIGNYDPQGRERRMQELYDASHKSIITGQSEKALEEMDYLINRYKGELDGFRKSNPEVERDGDVKRKIGELEKLMFDDTKDRE